MLSTAVPTKFPIPFANSAGPSFIRPIPEASQIGTEAGAASLTDGFPPVTFQPVASGGVPPFGEDFNGLLKQITLWNQWQAAGAPIYYDPTFVTAIGGYPKQAMIASATTVGLVWVSIVENNTTNPDTGGAGWQALIGPQSVTNAMLALAPARTIKGNLTGATGGIQDWSMAALFSALIGPNSITNALLQQAPAQTIRGNLINAPNNVADYTMAQLFGTLIGPGSITNVYQGAMPPATFKGNFAPGVSTPQDISLATLQAVLQLPGNGFDFSGSVATGWMRLGPVLINWGGGSSGSGNGDHWGFNRGFAGQPWGVLAQEGNPQGGWPGNSGTLVAAQVFPGDGTQFGVYTKNWTGSTWIFAGGIGFRYFAWGAA